MDDKIRTGRRKNGGGGDEVINKLGTVGNINEDDVRKNSCGECDVVVKEEDKDMHCEDEIEGKIIVLTEDIHEGQINYKVLEVRLGTTEAQSVALREMVDRYEKSR
ncbi:hypothetical protein SK128_000884 [Halocaridina rubra]|uniref:Uncharacterized protein n=1 Tax=Halocaridina rubra TaxID=373956 RepID=A0AAN9A529_HALRR